MNKKTIVEEVHERIGFSRREAAAIIESAFELMKEALAAGEPVTISSFGKFSTRQRRERRGRNPHTGEAITIPARKIVTFKVSRVLKEQINEAHRDRDPGKAVFQDR
jgi:integration host factor subunit alpha